jgi:hypothetical protein
VAQHHTCISVDGDTWFGNGAGTEIGRLFNDSGVLHLRGSANVTGLALGTNNTRAVTIDSSQRVGIGTTSPAPGGQGVHIHNPSAAASSLRVTNSTTGATDGDGFAIQVGSDGTAQLRQFESLALTFETAATERARIDSSGRLGIGTSSPGAKLDVTGGDLFVTPNTAGKNTITLTTNAVDDGRILIKSNTTTKVDIQANGTSYFDGGNVGIGSTAPQYPLHVETTGTGTAAGDNTSIIVQSQASGRDCNIRFGDSINASARIGYLSNNLYFYVNGNERARIDSSGKLLVGTSSARSTVKVDATSGNAPIIQLEGSNNGYSTSLSITNFNVNSYGPALALNASKGSQATPAAVSSGGDLGFLTFNGYDGANFIPGAHIAAFVDGTPGANDMPGRLVFSTTADGASTPTERLRIDSSGRVGIGTVSPTRLLTVQSTGNANLCIKTTNTGVSQCMFGDTDSDVAGNIAYLHSADAMTFETLGTERARIDSSGRLLVGTSSSTGAERVVIYNNPSSSGPGYLGLATGTASPANGINLGAVIYAASDGLSNTAPVIAGLFQSFDDVATFTTGVAQTLFVIPNTNATYIVTLRRGSVGDAANYEAVSILSTNSGGSVSAVLTDLKTAGTTMTMTLQKNLVLLLKK